MTVRINVMDEGRHTFIEHHIMTLEDKLGTKLPSLTEEERKKLEFIYDDPIGDLINAINNHPSLGGIIKATRI